MTVLAGCLADVEWETTPVVHAGTGRSWMTTGRSAKQSRMFKPLAGLSRLSDLEQVRVQEAARRSW
jgi:hypothetical protein